MSRKREDKPPKVFEHGEEVSSLEEKNEVFSKEPSAVMKPALVTATEKQISDSKSGSDSEIDSELGSEMVVTKPSITATKEKDERVVTKSSVGATTEKNSESDSESEPEKVVRKFALAAATEKDSESDSESEPEKVVTKPSLVATKEKDSESVKSNGKKSKNGKSTDVESSSLVEALAGFRMDELGAEKGVSRLSSEDKKIFEEQFKDLQSRELNFHLEKAGNECLVKLC
ncbi:PREDICTED: serrate RNA effector molecule homolog [Camelina sativa]|uniref:Serrate RNA effector molecule homolog n=1 Tax=Camelina sativa TaxID=90675 RepID=A0ABM1RBV7_CAMSA|nr:PREDICTED: serrate RNA effector molecule homolog [Camelina sativa]